MLKTVLQFNQHVESGNLPQIEDRIIGQHLIVETQIVEADHEIGALYRRNAEELGRTFLDVGPMINTSGASTDMGNVSLRIPSIHPIIGIDSLPVVNHQPEFTAHCVTESADKALFDGALAMAWTAIDVAEDESIRDRLLAK